MRKKTIFLHFLFPVTLTFDAYL